LRTDPELSAERQSIEHDFERAPDKTLAFVASMPLLYGGEVQPASSYVCPMHSDVTASEPEACPKCGMRLVPVQPETLAPNSYSCPMYPEITASEQGTYPNAG
jgi:hypothetical protein